MQRASFAFAFGLLVGGMPLQAAAPDDAQIDDLLQKLARIPPATTRYFERRDSPMLASPLLFGGQLEQPSPDVLVKTIEGDRAERMQIAGDRVQVQRSGQRTRNFSLGRAPELSALSGSMSALLAGDRAALERIYLLHIRNEPTHWELILEPREARLRKRVVGMRLVGVGESWRCLDLELEGGERSRMWLGDAAATAAVANDPERDAVCVAPAVD